jgi:hypothetical protein
MVVNLKTAKAIGIEGPIGDVRPRALQIAEEAAERRAGTGGLVQAGTTVSCARAKP